MSAIGKFILGYLLDWIKDLVVSWINKESKKKAKAQDIEHKKDRLKKAIDEAYNGKEITKDQRDEIINASRDLVRSYKL